MSTYQILGMALRLALSALNLALGRQTAFRPASDSRVLSQSLQGGQQGTPARHAYDGLRRATSSTTHLPLGFGKHSRQRLAWVSRLLVKHEQDSISNSALVVKSTHLALKADPMMLDQVSAMPAAQNGMPLSSLNVGEC